MRLNPFDTGKIDVRGGGGGMGGGGKLGCGAIVIALLGAVIFGIDPMTTLSTIGGTDQGTASAPVEGASEDELCNANQFASESCAALTSLNETWAPLFLQANVGFEQPFLQFLGGGTIRTGCGPASSAGGPFYCPADKGIYIDTRFYEQLDRQLGAPGDFARYYVMAHEYGHHIQTLTGIADQIRSAQSANRGQANQLQVLMELQADCYAGVWAAKNRNLIEPGDIEEGLRAASAIGDDTLMRRSGQRVNPESFTHGTSEQRRQALQLGLQGDDTRCDAITQLR